MFRPALALFSLLSFGGSSGHAEDAAAAPPIAAKRPHAVVSEQGTRDDPYYWLRDDSRADPAVLDHLRAETRYFEAVSATYEPLTAKLTRELESRVDPEDRSVPYRFKDYIYSTRYASGKQYPVWVRQPAAGGAEQILIDGNVEAAGKAYYSQNGRALSPNQNLLAFTEDTAGRYQNSLRFRDLATGKDLPDRIAGVRSGVVWAADNRTVFYVENDPVTLLSKRVKRHELGTDPMLDPVVYEEKDDTFYLDVELSSDERYLLIQLESTVASEIRVLAADDPKGAPRTLAPRESGVLYDADHVADRWVIRTDWKAPDFRLMTVADAAIGDRSRWREIVPAAPGVFLDGFLGFRDDLVILERSEGLLRLKYAPWNALDRWREVAADEPAFAQGFSVNADRASHVLRYHYSSLVTPDSTFEIDLRSGERKLLKRASVPGYDPSLYAAERLWATARDGTRVPVSIVYRKGFERDGTAPLYQYAYGAYGASIDPSFDSTVISLLDRGFVHAIAHVRGGQELGRAWYDAGRMYNKINTFTDFIDVTDFLVRERYVAPDKAFASGLSAGGLLMGAVANLAGDRYRGIAAHVPFVDAVTTMLDESIPLVTNEFDEWGDPRRKADYDYLLSYSPYDNVAPKAYPAMFVTTGLHDSQVQYYEPAKWVARLRATKTDSNPLLFKVNFEAGHGGRSGRFAALRETAEEYAFILNVLGVDR
jgi:oligopeptidase B